MYELVSFENDNFPTIQPSPHPLQTHVMPVVAYRGNKVRPVGTCFAISNIGLVLTARHVVEEALQIARLGSNTGGSPKTEWGLGCVYVSTERSETVDFVGGIIPARKVHCINSLDIAVMHLNVPVKGAKEEKLLLPALVLSPGLPKPGQTCFGLGYHSMRWDSHETSESTYSVFQKYSASQGLIESVHFPARDSFMLTFPCFRTSARFDKGMSGGPIIGESGGVIGVVCSSIESATQDGYVSYGSLVGPSLLTPIEAKDENGAVGIHCMYEFVEKGGVGVDDTYKDVKIIRDGNNASVQFVGQWGHIGSIEYTNDVKP